MYKHVSGTLHLVIFLLLFVLFGTISSAFYFISGETNVVPATTFLPTPTPVAPSPTIAPMPEEGWSMLRPGLERRTDPIYNTQNQLVESLHIWRLDQKAFRLDVAYASTPKSLDTWQRETNALMVVNGGFYSIDNERYFPDGLTIVDGKATGRSFNRWGYAGNQ